MRYRQWIKNLIIFLPLYFGHRISDSDLYLPLLALFASFCFLSSAVYLFNDICDIESDRLHATKRHRLIASGRLPISSAYLLISGLVVVSFGLPILLHSPLSVFVCLLLYLLINLVYSLRGKHWPVFDAFFVAAGFLLRLEAGGFAIGVKISPWLFLMVFFLSLLLAFGKRLEDIRLSEVSGKHSRPVVAFYSTSFLYSLLSVLSAVLVVFYTLYTLDDEVMGLNGAKLYYTVPFVALGLFYYLRRVIVDKVNCDPTAMLYHDHGLQAIILLWITSFTIIVYVV